MATQTPTAVHLPAQAVPDSRDLRFSDPAGLSRGEQADLGAGKQARDSRTGFQDASSELMGNTGLRRTASGHVANQADAELRGSLTLNPAIERLPVEMAVAIPVREFRVRDLLAMAPGVVIETQWTSGEDLPLSSGEVQLAWTEFEVVDTQLAVRVTRLG